MAEAAKQVAGNESFMAIPLGTASAEKKDKSYGGHRCPFIYQCAGQSHRILGYTVVGR